MSTMTTNSNVGWTRRLRRRDQSPDICLDPESKVRKDGRGKRRQSEEPLQEGSPKKLKTSRVDVTEVDYMNINRLSVSPDFPFSSPSKRLRPSERGEIEFSPNYDDDGDDDELGGDEILAPFVSDSYFPDTSLMDAFGSLVVPDPFFYSSEPLGVENGGSSDGHNEGNDGLNTPPHRSPSPIISPIMSPCGPPEEEITDKINEVFSERELRSRRGGKNSKDEISPLREKRSESPIDRSSSEKSQSKKRSTSPLDKSITEKSPPNKNRPTTSTEKSPPTKNKSNSPAPSNSNSEKSLLSKKRPASPLDKSNTEKSPTKKNRSDSPLDKSNNEKSSLSKKRSASPLDKSNTEKSSPSKNRSVSPPLKANKEKSASAKNVTTSQPSKNNTEKSTVIKNNSYSQLKSNTEKSSLSKNSSSKSNVDKLPSSKSSSISSKVNSEKLPLSKSVSFSKPSEKIPLSKNNTRSTTLSKTSAEKYSSSKNSTTSTQSKKVEKIALNKNSETSKDNSKLVDITFTQKVNIDPNDDHFLKPLPPPPKSAKKLVIPNKEPLLSIKSSSSPVKANNLGVDLIKEPTVSDLERVGDKEKTYREKIVDFVYQQYHSDSFYERPGKLKRLRLSNFMCHEKFDEEWHHQVNYISADNGSGKSALLVGLQLVFGAKASTTMRSTSVKDMIKYHNYTATIEVTLTNDGILDFEKYGREIVIIRTILYNGTSRYQIKTPDGKKRSLFRRELELIKATLQIMVDNPAMILNQEASRNFLRTSDPRELYTHFYRGVNLEPCEILLMKSRDDVQQTREALGPKHKILEELQTKAEARKSEYDAIVTLENGALKVKQLTIEYNWALVSKEEEEVGHIENNYNSLVQKCTKIEKELESVIHEQNSLESTVGESKKKLKTLYQNLRFKKDEYEQKRRESHTYRQDFSLSSKKLTDTTKSIADKTQRMTLIEAEIAKIRERSEKEYQAKLHALDTQKKALHDEKNRAKEELNREKNNKVVTHSYYDTCKQTEVEHQAKHEDVQFRIRERKHELMNIEKKKNSKYNRYGQEMVRLMNDVEAHVRRGAFIEPPLGPLSSCYTVKEEFSDFAPLIEHILGSSLYQIRVTHKQDKELLQRLMAKNYGKKIRPDIFYQPSKDRRRYNLPNIKAISGYNTVLDALDIIDDDPMVFNWLADANGFEKILLFRSEDEACHVMKEARRVPRGVQIAYSLNFKRIHADPKYRSMVVPIKKKANFLQITSHCGNASLVKKEIDELQTEATGVLRLLEAAKAETKVAKVAVLEVDRKLKIAQNEVNRIEASLQGLDETIAQGPDVASFVEDAEELKSGISLLSSERENYQVQVDEVRPKFEAAEKNKKVLEEEITKIESEIQEIEIENDYARKENDLKIKSKNLSEELSKYSASRNTQEKKLKEKSAELDNIIKVAVSKGERVDSKRDPNSIQEELKCLKQVLHKNKDKLHLKGKIQAEWEAARNLALTVEQDIKVAGSLIETLLPTIKAQIRRFEKKKHDFGITLQASFQALVSSRKFGGRLIIDHKERNLMYWVCPDDKSQERARAYTRNFEDCAYMDKKGMKDYIAGLSGGERSFSTICFMVSMWKTMESPFYVLDEFDVFMDSINRQASQNILNAHTRSQPEAQFFFITPLKLDSMIYPDNAKVLRLYPPIRDSMPPPLPIKSGNERVGAQLSKKGGQKKNNVSNKERDRDDFYDELFLPNPPRRN